MVNPDRSVLPRLVVAAPASNHGKTTVSVGIMAALVRRGLDVAPAKVGPDFIDPGYHRLATGRPGRNLDPWLVGPERIAPLLAHGASGADLAVIEGVMGLFDGQLGTDGFASTAHVAKLTGAPVVLVVDIGSASRSIAAAVSGLAAFDPDVTITGVILNKAGSDRHAAEVRRSVEASGLSVLGVIPRDAGVSVPSRHLGLVPADERDDAAQVLDRLAAQTEECVDLDALIAHARTAPALDTPAWEPPTRRRDDAPVVAIAGGRAFTFRYAETDEMLRALGCTPVEFDPALDRHLPDGTAGLYLGGGFPEVHARALSTNQTLLSEVRDAIASGVPTVAECAGMLYLARRVDGHRFADVLPTDAAMHPRLMLGYRTATTDTETLLARPGETVHGHEFHRTRTTPPAGTTPGWLLDGRPDGFAVGKVHASYLHVHWAGNPRIAERFTDAVHQATSFVRSAPTPGPLALPRTDAPAADHHGDREVHPDLIDLAVNVAVPAPPPWLHTILRDTLDGVAAYPSSAQASAALAARHGVDVASILPTNGGAEAFALIAQAIDGEATIVHPQFSEPDTTLAANRRHAQHVIAMPGAPLDPDTIDGDLVFVGNPTNPTGALHTAETLRALRRPGRVVVVDEAFMDAVPQEAGSLLHEPDLEGLLVLRSLTKTWGLAGVRAGYVVGDPELVRRLAERQSQWSVNSLALAAMVATATPAALREADALAHRLADWRAHLVRGLRRAGLEPLGSHGPFVTVRVGQGVREALRDHGFAVRRGDTFPGLGPEWIRIAVRDPHTIDAFLAALSEIRSRGAIA